MENMTIEMKRNEKELTIELSGRLDTTTAPILERAIGENSGDIEKLVLDFKGLEYISSAGLRVVLNTQKKMQQMGGMKVINVCEEVMEVFEITGFVDILVIE
jgi:anti-sigma B factor antagonist